MAKSSTRIIPSKKEIRWWFRSRQNNRPNLLSYWILVVFFSAILSFFISALWEYLVRQNTLLYATTNISDWIYKDWPSHLSNNSDFAKCRYELTTKTRWGYGKDDTIQPILVNAVKLNENSLTLKKASMYGIPDAKVFPSIISYSKIKDTPLTDEEQQIFKNFSHWAKNLFDTKLNVNDELKKDSTHMEESLANALGFLPSSELAPSYNIPWIYVASQDGAIAVYPATKVIGSAEWDIEHRPWFMGAFGGDTHLYSKSPFSSGDADDLLTVTYLDVLAKTPTLVRTLIYRYKGANDKYFVVCIDLSIRLGDRYAPASETSIPQTGGNTSYYFLFWPRKFQTYHYVIFASILCLILFLRWISIESKSYISFKKTSYSYGNINVKETVRMLEEELRSKEKSLKIEVGNKLAFGLKSSLSNNEAAVEEWIFEGERKYLRGFEFWDVQEQSISKWAFLGISFENTKTDFLGTAQIVFTNKILPETKWVTFNDLLFSEDQAKILGPKLLKLLQTSSELTNGSLTISAKIDDYSFFLKPPSVPEWAKNAADPKELLALRQCRAYVTLNSDQLHDLYLKADIKAVMTSGYFEQILNHDNIDFLLKGRTICRIISFPKSDSMLNLTSAAGHKLQELLDSYSSGSSRKLKRADVPIEGEDFVSPVYDFAILDDKAVVVAHFISRATGIDTASGKHTRSTHLMEGYLSWRISDVKFYLQLFDKLLASSREFTYSDFSHPQIS
jgi:hypothetical protein